MKKTILFSLILAASSMSVTAQTEFSHISVDEAQKVAKAENKLIFIDFFTTWCGPCKMMSNDIFPQKKVGDFMNKHFVNLKLDAEAEGADLAKKMGVRAYPTFVILDAEGNKISLFSGASDADRFLSRLEGNMDPELTAERVTERYNSGERNGKLVQNYARILTENNKAKESRKVLEDYYNSLSDADLLKDENVFLFQENLTSYDSPRTAFMENNLNKFSKESKEVVLRRLHNIYFREAYKYFGGEVYKSGKHDAAAYQTLKDKVANLGSSNEFARMFDLVDNRMALDNDAFLKYCENNFNNLAENEKQAFIQGLPQLFNTQANPEMRPRLASFIRTRLPEMTYNSIAMSAQVLYGLEI